MSACNSKDERQNMSMRIPSDIRSEFAYDWIETTMASKCMDFSDEEKFSIFCGTYNVAGTATYINGDLSKWIFSDAESALASGTAPYCDVYCLSFQEMVDLSTRNVVFDDSEAIERMKYFRDLIEISFLRRGLKYEFVASKYLVGLSIFVLTREELYDFVSDVRDTSLGVGVMGVMGNKGGVGIRFNLHDTSLCFVGAHFTANKKEIQARNSDYSNIIENLVFTQKEHASMTRTWREVQRLAVKDLKIMDHSMVFWIGDLNYRINESFDTIMRVIGSGDIGQLTDVDQLNIERGAGRVFSGFQEGPLRFNPTYKYQAGTDMYECRPDKKKREPAWCDRILYYPRLPLYSIDLSFYLRAEMVDSDHRPVMARFNCIGRRVNDEKEKDVYRDLIKTLDKLENDKTPKMEISTRFVEFHSVSYKSLTTTFISLKNVGTTAAKWRFIKKDFGDADGSMSTVSKSWVHIEPSLGVLLAEASVDINISVYIDESVAQKMIIQEDSFDDILVLHIENGCDFFVSLTGEFNQSSYVIEIPPESIRIVNVSVDDDSDTEEDAEQGRVGLIKPSTEDILEPKKESTVSSDDVRMGSTTLRSGGKDI